MDEFHSYINQTAFARLWRQVKDKYERLGRIGGTVFLTAITVDEREALAGLLAVNLHGQSDVTVRLPDLEVALQNSRFGVGILDCLKTLFPDSVQTHIEQKQGEAAKWSEFCRWAIDYAEQERVREWVNALASNAMQGYRAFLDCYDEYRAGGTSHAWVMAIRALEQLPSRQPVRLPVFAAKVTGDSHGLDRETLAGKVLYQGIFALFTENGPLDADGTDGADGGADYAVAATLEASGIETTVAPSELVRSVYATAGILLDDVSSVVWVGNWQGFYREPVAVPLLNLNQRTAPVPTVNAVYVVENPAVFAALVESRNDGLPVVCTSGQPSVAALRLLDLAVEGGATLFYSGDFDVKGLQMAISLRNRYRGELVPWRMDTDTYQSIHHEALPRFTSVEQAALMHLDVDWDPGLVEAMVRHGRKVFQEHILNALIDEYMRGN